MDKRFKRLATDPVFKRAKRDANKTVVDGRFASMLESKEFGGSVDSGTAKVDKYGRKKQTETGETLKRFYRVQETIGADSESLIATSKENGTDCDSNSEQETALNDSKFDFARGEGNVESSSDEQSGLDSDVEMIEDEDGFYADEEIPVGQETHRLAVVNMDWDHVKSKDLFKVFDAFKPKHGKLVSVKIYTSDFGKEKMRIEAISGPPSAIFADDSENDDLINHDEGKEFNVAKLRKYQIDRLRFSFLDFRYYYAIVETDCVGTAIAINAAVDGTEFESSANFFDLRYVPDDTEFNDEAFDETLEAPMIYEGTEFVTHALQHSNVKLTWDAEDPERSKVTRRKFTKDDLKNMDFKAYLASESEDDMAGQDEETKLKYQALMAEEESNDSHQDDMEITFTPGLSEKAEKLMGEKREKEAQIDETVFDKYMRKRKEKRKMRKDGKKDIDSESEVDDDPFFQVDFGPEFDQKPANDVEVVDKKKVKKELKLIKLQEAKQKAELELLLVDESNVPSKHFDRKDVLKNEKSLKKKRGKKVSKVVGDTQDDFEIDLVDSRFGSILDSHDMAIDPTNSQFKHTKSMDRILSHKRNQSKNLNEIAPKLKIETVKDKSIDISMLVESVKRHAAVSASKSSKGKRTDQAAVSSIKVKPPHA